MTDVIPSMLPNPPLSQTSFAMRQLQAKLAREREEHRATKRLNFALRQELARLRLRMRRRDPAEAAHA
jgi:hypothetical protein